MSMLALLQEHSQLSFFNDGPDPFIGMDMAEAATASVFMMQDAITEGVEITRRNDEMCLRAVMTESASPQYLIEASAGSLMDKIKAVFEKIKKFLIGIVNKIKMFFDKIFMSSKALVSKYKNSDVIKNNTFDDIEYMGYSYIDDIGGKWKDDSITSLSAEELCSKCLGIDFTKIEPVDLCSITKADKEGTGPNSEVYRKTIDIIENVKDMDESDRKLRVINYITGENLTNSDTVHSDLMEILQGGDSSKVNITGVDKYKVIDYLSKPEKEEKILKFYSDMVKSVDKTLNEFKKECQFAISKEKAEVNKGNKDYTGIDLFTTSVNTLVSATSSAYKNANIVGSVKVAAIQGKVKQYRMLFGKMMSYKKRKNEEFDIIDTFDDIDSSVFEYIV